MSVIKCNAKTATSFAIFIDSKSFLECKDEVLAYKNILEQEGLGTYILYANWSDPNMVKNEIDKLASKKPQLEGMVFIGDIPIVRIRKGQHMTTAFKMNEITFPMNEASVPSDRFYDCPTLKFNFVKRDSVNNNWFYYNLSEKGAQYLSPAYYSARMVVPPILVKATGIDKYTLLRRYLLKVIAAHKENNPLDKFIYFAGHGYNSDCLTAWRQQSIAFKSHF
ncbi:MAG: HEAT repeat domain-containing protein, partial [Bacteroidales bacterium]